MAGIFVACMIIIAALHGMFVACTMSVLQGEHRCCLPASFKQSASNKEVLIRFVVSC